MLKKKTDDICINKNQKVQDVPFKTSLTTIHEPLHAHNKINADNEILNIPK
jgi:hypothetical protein